MQKVDVNWNKNEYRLERKWDGTFFTKMGIKEDV